MGLIGVIIDNGLGLSGLLWYGILLLVKVFGEDGVFIVLFIGGLNYVVV